jgi:hypothetical protein
MVAADCRLPTKCSSFGEAEFSKRPSQFPRRPRVVADDGSGEHLYALIAVGPQGRRSAASPSRKPRVARKLRWDSFAGADAYVVIRDGKEITGPLRIEGSNKEWTDKAN